jgi:uncharacterized protein YaiL (DUF2058 family)
MTDSLRDQLMGLGFKRSTPEKKPAAKSARGKPHTPKGSGNRSDASKKPHGPRPPGKATLSEEFDLARAYAARNAQEQRERAEAERLAQEQARLKREARAKLNAFLTGKTLNDEAAEIARHFEYGGKIKRVYVTESQLKALNAGELGVVQQNGRYLLVTAETLSEAEKIFAQAVALKIDPGAPTEDDPYSDPAYQVPDDLVW